MAKKRLSALERKELILSKVKELCTKNGFAGTTLDEIAKSAGVSRALVIQLFGNKENLYKELLNNIFKDHPMEKDPNILHYAENNDDLGVFLAFAEHIYNNMALENSASPLRLLMFIMLEKPDIYRDHFQNRRLKGIKILEEYLIKGIREKRFKEVNVHHISICFSAMIIYVILEKITLQGKLSKEEFIDIMKTTASSILNGIKRR